MTFFRYKEFKTTLDVLADLDRTLRPAELKLILKKTFDIIYGHLDHLSPAAKARPWINLAYSPTYEKQHLLLQQAISQFVDKGIYQTTGLDLNAFLKLPYPMKNYLLEKLTQEVQKKEKIRSEIEQQFK